MEIKRSMEELEVYFAGQKLFGDDFSIEEIKKWYEDEKEAYANLGAKDAGNYRYMYHALNQLHGFRYLPNKVFENVLGLGSAYGDEFMPTSSRIQHLTILEPSTAFTPRTTIPTSYVKPSIDGEMPFDNGYFDLITSLGVLHHIPNVTMVIKEISRCLSLGGYSLIREPIVSMGDWTKPRPGLTKRERGIPLNIFREILNDSGLTIVRESFCILPIMMRLGRIFNIPVYNNTAITWLDAMLSNFLIKAYRYHSEAIIHKLSPVSVYYVLSKTL